MAGVFNADPRHNRNAARAYTPPMSQGWKPLGFITYPARGALPAASSTGSQDIRVPVGSQQINQVAPTNWQGIQLRQFQCLLSRRWNIAYSASILAEQKLPYLQLANNKTGTGLGAGKLKSLNVNAPSNFNNLLAKATSYGRYQNRVPVA